MKIRFTIILIIALITFQSFFYHSGKQEKIASPSYFKAFPSNISLCAPRYNSADSLADIPALQGWGYYKWKISNATDSAQFYFNQGINMYYAFHSIEAIASFTKATHLDPNCAMAWYGKALAMGPTINYPNGYRPPSDALEAAVKSKSLYVNCTPLEKDLIDAIQHRYNADTTMSVKQLRINYADAMGPVYQKYKTNADAVTLYADALLLLHPWDLYQHDFTPKPWTPQIRSLLEQAIALSPNHPGANHFYIHAVEASATPGLATKSAHLMDTLMPGVSHLTHMSSHIYIRTGDYRRGIKVNDDAVAGYIASIKRYAPIENGFVLYQAHNMHMKVNCAQMSGNYKTAIDEANALQKDIPGYYLTAPGADGNYIQYIYAQPDLTNVRFGKWDEILKTPVVDTLVYVRFIQHFSRGMAYSGKGDVKMAKKEMDIVDHQLEDKALKPVLDNFNSAYQAGKVAQFILKGTIAGQQKQYTTAINYLQQAVKAEDDLIYDEPRDWPIPARQYLGDMLLKAGKYEQAIAVLKHDLVINPHNGWALTGLETVYQQTNNTAALKTVSPQVKNAWKIKDMEIKGPVF